MKRLLSSLSLSIVLVFFVQLFCIADESAEEIITIKGTIKRFSSEGGFYGIKGDDGREYRPIQLTPAFKIEGLKVNVSGRLVEDRFLFKPQFKTVEIINIERASGDDVAGKRVYADPSEPIEVNAGETFIIKMDSNPTTGFMWKLARPIDKKILKWRDVYYLNTNETGMLICGAGCEERWVFKAAGAGETTLYFKYIRPWEKNVPPAEKAEFKIVVHQTAETP